MWPGSDPCVDSICGSSSLSILLSIALGGFSLGTPVVPSPQKPTIPNSNSFRKQVDEELPNAGCATSKSLFIHFFIHSFIYFSNPFSLITSPGVSSVSRSLHLPFNGVSTSALYVPDGLSICLSVCLSTFLSVCLSVVSVRLYICLVTYLYMLKLESTCAVDV